MKIKNNNDLEILTFSDAKYDKLTAEIQYLGEPIAQVNQDMGKDNLELELFTDFADSNFILKFSLLDFIKALDLAKEALLE